MPSGGESRLRVDNWHWWGFLVVIFLAAMQTVDPEPMTRMKLDGGGRWREFGDVAVPSVLPTLILILLLTIIASLLVFDYIYRPFPFFFWGSLNGRHASLQAGVRAL